jgi:tetratricopeptide (TPR) repeat protein
MSRSYIHLVLLCLALLMSPAGVRGFDEPRGKEPLDAAGFYKRGYERCQRGEYDKAIEDFDAALRLDPKNEDAYCGRGSTWLKKGEYDKAFKDYAEAMKLNPKNKYALMGRGNALGIVGQYDKAAKDFDEVIRLDPKSEYAFYGRGNVWYYKGKYDKAYKDFDEAIRLNPKYAKAFLGRGGARIGKGDYSEAVKDFDEAIQLEPRSAWGYSGKALILASCPIDKYRDGKKAVELALKACELQEGMDASFWAILAAAYAETGEFSEAVKWQKKALDDKNFIEYIGEEARECLNLYEQKKPYRISAEPANAKSVGKTREK